MARERQLDLRREDHQLGAVAIADEHGLGEPEVCRHSLAILVGNPHTVEEDPERVAPAPVVADEDAEDVEAHESGQRIERKRSTSQGVTWIRYSSHSCRFTSMNRLNVCSPRVRSTSSD